MSSQNLPIATPEELKLMWAEGAKGNKATEAVLLLNGFTFPVPDSLRFVDAGPLAPDGKPVLAMRYQTKAQPWSAIFGMGLDSDMRIITSETTGFVTADHEPALASIRFGLPNKRISVVFSLALALQKYKKPQNPVWCFAPSGMDVSGEIPDTARKIEISVLCGAGLPAAKALSRVLHLRGKKVSVSEYDMPGARPTFGTTNN